MIPVRMGSKRIPKKNIRMLNGKPLVCYIIETAVKAKKEGLVDEVYINSEDDVFQDFAKQYGVRFYKRHPDFAQDHVTNDDFAYDFMANNPEIKTVIQLLATSPFLSLANIADVSKMIGTQHFETVVSLKGVQIECLYKGKPVNFDRLQITLPSQMLLPVEAYACSIMAWKTASYMERYENCQGAYHGGNGDIGYYQVSGYATLDIDNEEDFLLAEQIAQVISQRKISTPEYYAPERPRQIEVDVPAILQKDGIASADLFDANKMIVGTESVIKEKGNSASWAKRLIDTDCNSATLICQ
ncbi:MAG TPA: hypothetical protein VEA58_11755, partial [Anaerovoracaceae bacterium]|nr:hypothetical protein [Anaerovoracaceae bacterium]